MTSDLQFQLELAAELGKTLEDIRRLTVREYLLWVARAKKRARDRKKAMDKAKRARGRKR